MVKYYFKECLPTQETTEINVSTKYRTSPHTIEHTHDFYELILVCENQLSHTLNNKTTNLTKNSVCLIAPNDSHVSAPVNQAQPPIYYTISIKASYIENLTNAINKNFLSLILANRYAIVKAQTFEQCKQLLDQALFLPVALTDKKQFLYQTVVTKLLTEFNTDTIVKKRGQSLVENAYSLMLDDKNIGLSVKDIAQNLGYSEEHFIRTFKKNSKQTPSKVFTKIKLDYASELLIATDFSISEVCDKIGYYSQHYFNKIFKNQFGCSPSNYRKKNSIPF